MTLRAHIELLSSSSAPEVGAAAISHFGAEQVQRAQASEGGDMRQTRVCDLPRVQVQRFKLRQQCNLPQPVIADSYTRQQSW